MSRTWCVEVSPRGIRVSDGDRTTEYVVAAVPLSVEELARGLSSALPSRESRSRRARANVRLAYPFAQIKRLDGLSRLGPRLAARAAVENADAFFLSTSKLIVTKACTDETGSVWAAALDSRVVDAVLTALRARGWKIAFVCPGDDLLPSNLGRQASKLRWRPAPPVGHTKRMHRLHLAVATIAVAVSALAALIGPAVRSRRVVRQLAAELRESSSLRAQATRARGDIARATATLASLNSFLSRRRGTSSVFVDLTASLPESTAITTLHVDSAEANVVVVATHAIDVLPALSDALPKGNVRLTSAVSHETMNGLYLERAAFRVQLGPSKARAPHPSKQ